MKFRFTIGRKLYTGFGIFIFATLVVFLLTNQTLNNSRKINDRINQVYIPSVEQLEKLRYEINRTRMLITNWAFVQSREDTQEKLTLNQISQEDLPETVSKIEDLSLNWSQNEISRKQKILTGLNELLEMYDVVKAELPDMQSYDEDFHVFFARDYAEDGGIIDTKAKEILFDLNNLIINMRKNTEQESKEMISSFNQLKTYLRTFGVLLIIGGILIALLTGRSIVKPVRQLKTALISLGKGVVPDAPVKITNDEIGEMSLALNNLMDGFKRTTEFAGEVGRGQFDFPYQPLSENDKLGEALKLMAVKLGRNEKELERQVQERTSEVVKQSEKIEELYKDVTDSIKYAKRLQETILPPDDVIKGMFADSFVLFKPKDIVSGDFYWFKQLEHKKLFAVVDSTGHGVPGAFMSLVGFNGLNEAVKDNQHDIGVSRVMKDFHLIAQNNLNKTREYNNVRDSMDMALCIYDESTQMLEYSGANIPLYVVRGGVIQETKPNKCSIGSMEHGDVDFKRHQVYIEQGDKVYLFSDGYVDQFGGPRGRKLMYNQFRKIILDVHQMPMEDQRTELISRLENWKRGQEQVDDILIVGISF
jgi:serine phosphatase RsbU (regulator of sigma subunit)/HAMP domain-containing protein